MIPLMKVRVPPKEELMPALEETLYSGMLTEGKRVIEFEEKLQKEFGFLERPLTTNSCTAALQLAYRCENVRNKIVLATPMTCTATNMPVFAEGGKIVWCDVDENGMIDVADVRKKIEQYGPENIAAISFVDFAGYLPNITELARIREQYEIPLIEDAAQSLGARWYDVHVGAIEWIDHTCLSFQAIKHLTTADGGALVMNPSTAKLNWEKAKRLKWYGINREAVKEATRWHYDIPDWGYKFHMNNVAATLGLAQLKNFRHEVLYKHQNNGWFLDLALSEVDGISQIQNSESNCSSAYWIYMVKVERREDFAKMMLDAGIAVNVAHIRNDQYSCFKDPELVLNADEDRPGLEDFNNRYIAIPCGWWVTRENLEYIVETIKKGW
jgi:dTDP-4-amino-4,6-dideoxygalactose transaminase